MARSTATTVDELRDDRLSTEVEQRLRDAYAAADTKLDMGKSCVRFKRVDQLVPEAIAAAISEVTVDDYIALYEASR